jgi:putative transposase
MRLKPQTYALTAVCYERHRIFQRIVNAELLVQTLLRYRDQGRFLLHGFVVMPDHLHILLTPTESIEKAAQLIKGGFSFAVRKQYTDEVWQEGYFAHRVTDASDYEAQLGYIAQNHARKRYVDYPYVHTTGAWVMDEPPDNSFPLEARPSPGG